MGIASPPNLQIEENEIFKVKKCFNLGNHLKKPSYVKRLNKIIEEKKEDIDPKTNSIRRLLKTLFIW